MITLPDQDARNHFIHASGRNISVIAPAGVGKTTALVQRIVALAQRPPEVAADLLARLVVVTYSVRAAQQMQQKARVAIRAAQLSPGVQRAFQQVFFGTIHSYCVQLLDRFGHYLGLPSPVSLLLDQDEVWHRFLSRGMSTRKLDPNLQELFHFHDPARLYALGREIAPGTESKVGPTPQLDLQALLQFPLQGLHSSSKRALSGAQAAAARWNEAWARGDRFYPLPRCPNTKQEAFVTLWNETFAPLHQWLREAALQFSRRVANDYEAYRLEQALMTYEDQVRLALRVLNLPAVQAELALERPSVLLDEAQDTDPRQFDVLLRVAGIVPGATQPDDQSFCIVGDFQQAIYTPRSDLSIYRKIHDALIVEPRGSSSQLEVTFRCDEAIINFVNRIFPELLHGREGQSNFFTLQARDGAGPGLVARWLCPDEPNHPANPKLKAGLRALHEARSLARYIADVHYTGLQADSWAQVAILCPRRNWLLQIARELEVLKVPFQLHSSDRSLADRTAAVWLTALVWIAAHPEDSFEIAGVLREVLGVSDHDMAHFTEGDGERLRLDRPLSPDAPAGHVALALNILRAAIRDAAGQPLHLAVERLVSETRLRERLDAIAELDAESSRDDLDEFLAAVLERAAGGVTLADLAEELRAGPAQNSQMEEETREGVQLMTSYKSKGLEWQTVIVPFMFRGIERRNPAYPHLVYLEGGDELVVRDKADYAAHARTFVSARERQQLQRLLYVTCTRAKQTLLLVDDEALFASSDRRGSSSSAELLEFTTGSNRELWEELPVAFAPVALDRPEVLTPDEKPPALLFPDDIAAAIARSRDIPQRVTPHALAKIHRHEAEPEEARDREPEASVVDPQNAGILYGLWWHEFIQAIDWAGPLEGWQRGFERALPTAPQPDRARREWDLFVASSLARWLREPGRICHAEAPFLWTRSPGQLLEGIIDLAVYTPGEDAWQVIDWKTNRLAGTSSAELLETYRGQLAAYAEALRGLLGKSVRAGIYLNASGEWLQVE